MSGYRVFVMKRSKIPKMFFKLLKTKRWAALTLL